MIQTVSGPVPVAELGFTSMHEHVMMFTSRGLDAVRWEKPALFDNQGARPPEVRIPWPAGREAALTLAVRHLRAAREAGIRTILDCTPAELGRDLTFVAEASRLADVHIVVSTGLMGKLPATAAPFEEIGLDRSVDLFVEDITKGIGLTGVRAGAFKTAIGMGNHTDLPPGFLWPEGIQPDSTLADGLPPSAEFALRVAGRVQRRTGVLVNVHTSSRYRTGVMACDLLEDSDADLTRVAIHHAGETDDVGYLHGLLDRGVTLCMDPHRYAWRLPIIARLVAEGYAGQLVLGVDSVLVEEVPLPDFWFADPRERDEREPEWVPSHVPRAVLPGLRDEGVSEADLHRMTVANPARLLAGTTD